MQEGIRGSLPHCLEQNRVRAIGDVAHLAEDIPMLRLINTIRRDRSGATAIEYGLIAALISLVIIGGAQLAGGSLAEMFTGISETLNTATPDGGTGGGTGGGEVQQ